MRREQPVTFSGLAHRERTHRTANEPPRFYRPLLPTLNISLAWIYNDDAGRRVANNERDPADTPAFIRASRSDTRRESGGHYERARRGPWRWMGLVSVPGLEQLALDRRRRSVKVGLIRTVPRSAPGSRSIAQYRSGKYYVRRHVVKYNR